AISAEQTCVRHRLGEGVLDATRSDAPASLDEDEVAQPAVSRVRQGALRSATGQPLVELSEGNVVKGDSSLVVELAEWDPQLGAIRSVVHQAVEFEVQQLTHAQSGVAQDGDADAGKGVGETGHCSHDGGVDIGWEGPGRHLGLTGN